MSFKSRIGNRHLHFTQLDSTNSEARRMIEDGTALEGLVITTDYQTQGRGQYGRTWNSNPGDNIMMSIVLAPRFLKIENQFSLNICISLAIAKVVNLYCENVSVKWPNDIYINTKKVAGILIQNFIQASRINHSIIGIGLNVLQQSWPSEIINATSVSLDTIHRIDKQDIVYQIYEQIDEHYSNMQIDNNGQLTEYQNLLFRKNEVSLFQHEGVNFSGTICGIDNLGRLLIERDGVIKPYNHGQISLIIN